jgi:hypothetical protein
MAGRLKGKSLTRAKRVDPLSPALDKRQHAVRRHVRRLPVAATAPVGYRPLLGLGKASHIPL